MCFAPAHADSWARPVIKEVFSASRTHFVRIVPGESLGDLVGFQGDSKGRYASAEFYRRAGDRSYQLVAEASLLNPVAPIEFFVSDEGGLATIDNWHNLGYGKVVVLYDPRGKLIRAYELAELLPAEQVQRLPRSVSSLHWRTGPLYIRPDRSTLLVTVKSGADLLFGLESGNFQYCENQQTGQRCRYWDRPGEWVTNGKIRVER